MSIRLTPDSCCSGCTHRLGTAVCVSCEAVECVYQKVENVTGYGN